ncbi:hypothetical protein ACW0TN_06450 [Fusobacterium pseudoperiodonticum]
MAYIDKTIGETLIKSMYKSVRESIKLLDKLIEENEKRGLKTFSLKGNKVGKIELLKKMIIEIRELEDE